MTCTDEELVARSREGDVDSFNQLILRWERPIHALAYRVIGRDEDARDVCQETFLRAYRALPGSVSRLDPAAASRSADTAAG
jgi:RNA polymerase sigma-70 factor, ECF subfamily